MIDFVEKLSTSSKIINIDYVINYILFCFNHKITDAEIDTENHHILPRALYPEYIKEQSNIVKLSAKNHFIAHYLLTLASDNIKFLYAFNMMKRIIINNQDSTDISMLCELYSHKRREICELISSNNKNKPCPESSKKLFKELYKDSVIAKFPSELRYRRVTLVEYHNSPGMTLASSLVSHTENHKKYLSALYTGRKCYTDGKNTIWLNKHTNNPENYTQGMPPKFSETCSIAQTGLLYYHNPSTSEQTRLNPAKTEIPIGWVPGRINFGEHGNFFANFTILHSYDKTEVFHLEKNSNVVPPRYFCYLNSTNYYISNNKISYSLSRLGLFSKLSHKDKIISSKSRVSKSNKLLIGKPYFESGSFYIY